MTIQEIPAIWLSIARIGLLFAMVVIGITVSFVDTFSLHSLQTILGLQMISAILLILCARGLHQESDWAVMLCWISVTYKQCRREVEE